MVERRRFWYGIEDAYGTHRGRLWGQQDIYGYDRGHLWC